MFQSTKIFDGFSCCFRQWKATTTHCRFLHGYGVSFKVTFEGKLDDRNWVWDFGGMKRAKTLIDDMQPKAWMDYMFDEATGAEKFSEFIFHKLNNFVKDETNERVQVRSVEFMEHGKNTAIYSEKYV